jgi:hypothetical protein
MTPPFFRAKVVRHTHVGPIARGVADRSRLREHADQCPLPGRREADVEWGRVFGERPYFEKKGCPPNPDDLYTTESVRTSLLQLIEKLTAGET